jgi:arylsulfatase A-like enzyme
MRKLSPLLQTCFLLLMSGSAVHAGRPNVVFILTDDQGYGDVGAHGNPHLKTPAMDALYRDSVRFTDFHVAPLCTPTRASLMSGCDPFRCRAWDTHQGRHLLRSDYKTIAEAFVAGGYQTALFGKWHLGDSYPFRPEDRGFQEVVRHGGGGVVQAGNHHAAGSFNATYLHNGKWERFPGYCNDVWFDQAIKFIERNKSKPFFCYLATNAPHSPHVAPPADIAPYANLDIPEYGNRIGGLRAFYGQINSIDRKLADLRSTLDRLNIADNTILVFMGDNGSAMGSGVFNGNRSGGKASPQDGGHRVPCYVRWPAGRMTGGRDIDELTSGVDIFPTLVDLCGLDSPDGTQKFDGVSLARLLRMEQTSLAPRTIFTGYARGVDPPTGNPITMRGKFRLLGFGFFNIQSDPLQQHSIRKQAVDSDKYPNREDDPAWVRAQMVADVQRRVKEYKEDAFTQNDPILIGDPKQPFVELFPMEWRPIEGFKNASYIATITGSPDGCNGSWIIKAVRSGAYEVSLYRWWPYLETPINDTPAALRGKKINAAHARVNFGKAGVSEMQPVLADTVRSTFEVDLPAGETEFQAEFLDSSKAVICGAFFVEIRFVGTK